MAAQTDTWVLDARKPFSRADARRAGIPVKHLSSGRFRRLFYDLYIDADVKVTALVLASAALSLSPVGAHISHQTAARLWGGTVPNQPLTHISSPHGNRGSEREGVRRHQTAPGSDVVTRSGVRVSSPAQTFIDLATVLNLVDLVVLGDSLVGKGNDLRSRMGMDRTTPLDLIEAALGWKGKGCRAARKAARLVRAEVDSPMETRLRLLMVLAGLPEPVVNHIEYDEAGRWTKRFDLSYPELKVIIEYDGRHHAEDGKQWKSDITRRESLDADGWRIIVIQARDIYGEPGATLARIVGAMRLAGARGLPKTLNHDWERHFPPR